MQELSQGSGIGSGGGWQGLIKLKLASYSPYSWEAWTPNSSASTS